MRTACQRTFHHRTRSKCFTDIVSRTTRGWLPTAARHFASHSSGVQELKQQQGSSSLDFNNIHGFGKKSTWELVRSNAIFTLLSYPSLMNLGLRTVQFTYGPRFPEWLKPVRRAVMDPLVKHSFFAQFCGGENADDVQHTIRHLEGLGVHTILDYAAESDLEEAEGLSASEMNDMFRQNLDHYLDAIRIGASSSDEEGGSRRIAAIKLTSLGDVRVLERVSTLLNQMGHIFYHHSTRLDGADGQKSVDYLDQLHEAAFKHSSPPTTLPRQRGLSSEGFARALDDIHSKLGLDISAFFSGGDGQGVRDRKQAADGLFRSLDLDGSHMLDFSEWMGLFVVDEVHACVRHVSSGPGALSFWQAVCDGRLGAGLDSLAEDSFQCLWDRVDEVTRAAHKDQFALLIDAEHSYFQPAIDLLTISLMHRYNRVNGTEGAPSAPTVFNTYQLYLKDALERMKAHMLFAEMHGFQFGLKAVRGAYMVLEGSRAKKLGYPNPVHATYQDTHDAYQAALDLVLDGNDAPLGLDMSQVHMVVASHNVQSASHAASMLHGRSPETLARVYFAQLLGMCDHVSLGLAEHGYPVYKYVPYGPLEEVIPYLVRRAEENSAVLGSPGIAQERQLVRQALWARLSGRDGRTNDDDSDGGGGGGGGGDSVNDGGGGSDRGDGDGNISTDSAAGRKRRNGDFAPFDPEWKL